MSPYAGIAHLILNDLGNNLLGKLSILLMFLVSPRKQHRQRQTGKQTDLRCVQPTKKPADTDLDVDAGDHLSAQACRIEDMAASHLEKELEILPESELKQAVTMFVEKEENSCIKEFVDKSLASTQKHLIRESRKRESQFCDDDDDDVLGSLVQEHKNQVKPRYLFIR